MNNPKNTYTIKDLENLTGIKAHTIRIWEKRYNVLQPLRTDNNNRVYDNHALQKLLNINTLNKFGYKISAIAKMPQERLPVLVREITSNKTLSSHVLNNFKVAMLNFDVPLFFSTFNTLLAEKSFRDIFYECFMPLLKEIGDLWQTGTITPAHEHFISSLIKQKIAVNTEKLQAQQPTKTDRVFILYLPDEEIHDICLLFINYELLLNGYKTIYIGESVPFESLATIKGYFSNPVFVSYFTTYPEPALVTPYVKTFISRLLDETHSEFWAFGRNASYINPALLGGKVKTFNSMEEFSKQLNQ